MAPWIAVGQRIQSKAHRLATILAVEGYLVTVEWVDETTGFFGVSGYSVEEVQADWTPCLL